MSLKDDQRLFATLTSKGQLTLPKALRDELHLDTGDKVELRLQDGEVMLRPMPRAPRDLTKFIGILNIEGSAAQLIDELRHTPEERRDLQAGQGAKVIKLADFVKARSS
ncbi:AbrB/MazE/SpoVT family DNA-binding domain-containing protein [Deinococcus sp.]|uniref:AbrB/MazE/SpoVT family DNA-binding domain-containing protein n=1 Tax=Deinococcus sp. TaxID=47478 RepID=UPI003B5C1DD3